MRENMRERRVNQFRYFKNRVNDEIRKERQMQFTCVSPGRIRKPIGLED